MERRGNDKGSYRYFLFPTSSADYTYECLPTANILATPIRQVELSLQNLLSSLSVTSSFHLSGSMHCESNPIQSIYLNQV